MNSLDKSESAARTQAILDERARRLAQPLAAATPSQAVELLRFDLASERYAIETSFVRRIARLPKLSPVPGVPDHFAGAVNLHGEIVPIIDLCPLLGTSTDASTDGRRVIVLGRDRAEFGIIVDAADEISTIDIEMLDKPVSTQFAQPFVRIVLHDALIILDGASLLDDPRLFLDRKTTPVLSPEVNL